MLVKFLFFFIMMINFAFAINPGEKSPGFTLLSHTGKKVSLSDFEDKFIILEWFNYGCPYVNKHYSSGNIPAIQRLYNDNDYVVWLSISSSAPGKQGYMDSVDKMVQVRKQMDMQSKYLLNDADGSVGKLYAAKVTPQIVIIDSKGVVQYNGAIDSIASAQKSDILKAKNYITSSMSKLLLGDKPNPAKTRPYGCSVKY